jgi:hypothetical protein
MKDVACKCNSCVLHFDWRTPIIVHYIVHNSKKDSIPDVTIGQRRRMESLRKSCVFGTLSWLFLLLAIHSSTLSTAVVISKFFTADLTLDDKISNVSLITECPARSPMQCSVKCSEGCTCFGFNSNTKMCRIHESCDSSVISIGEPGWRYFTGKHIYLFVFLLI